MDGYPHRDYLYDNWTSLAPVVRGANGHRCGARGSVGEEGVCAHIVPLVPPPHHTPDYI